MDPRNDTINVNDFYHGINIYNFCLIFGWCWYEVYISELWLTCCMLNRWLQYCQNTSHSQSRVKMILDFVLLPFRLLVFCYDALTLPIFYLIQKPWIKRWVLCSKPTLSLNIGYKPPFPKCRADHFYNICMVPFRVIFIFLFIVFHSLYNWLWWNIKYAWKSWFWY